MKIIKFSIIYLFIFFAIIYLFIYLFVQERLELESLLQSLVAQDPTSCYAQLRSAVLRCNKIRNIPGTHQQMALENQVLDIRIECTFREG